MSCHYELAGLVGFETARLALFGILYPPAVLLLTHVWVLGWSLPFGGCSLIYGISLVSLGMFGHYVGRICMKVNGRPLYVVREQVGVSPTRIGRAHEHRALV